VSVCIRQTSATFVLLGTEGSHEDIVVNGAEVTLTADQEVVVDLTGAGL